MTVTIIFHYQNADEFTRKTSTQIFTQNKVALMPNKLQGVLFVTVCDHPIATYRANCLCSTFRVAEQIYLVSRAAVERVLLLLLLRWQKGLFPLPHFLCPPRLPHSCLAIKPNTQWADFCVSLWSTCLMMTHSLSDSEPHTHTHTYRHTYHT
jgi:hypothetical protein